MIRVAIDGLALSPGGLEFHYQDDPYPGGHCYEVRIEESEFITRIHNRFDACRMSALSRSESSFVFSWLRWFTTAERANSKPKYFLNTIDSLEIKQHEIILIGRCSPAL